MAELWKYRYQDHKIEVKNNMTTSELYVDGQLQDQRNGLFTANLKGKLVGGEEIKASLKAGFVPKCALYINDELQTPTED